VGHSGRVSDTTACELRQRVIYCNFASTHGIAVVQQSYSRIFQSFLLQLWRQLHNPTCLMSWASTWSCHPYVSIMCLCCNFRRLASILVEPALKARAELFLIQGVPNDGALGVAGPAPSGSSKHALGFGATAGRQIASSGNTGPVAVAPCCFLFGRRAGCPVVCPSNDMPAC
jgi:hypothetical protein